MRRRTFLACLAGGTALSAGCNASLFGANASREVYNPSGHAAIRPLDEPYVRQGLTSDSEQYLYARLFRPGDSPPVTETQDAAEFSDAVDDLSGDRFAVLTNLRTAAAAPAYLWPTGTDWSDGRLRIELERRAKTPSMLAPKRSVSHSPSSTSTASRRPEPISSSRVARSRPSERGTDGRDVERPGGRARRHASETRRPG